MKKFILLILCTFISSQLSAITEDYGFPKAPKTTLECQQAAQAWINANKWARQRNFIEKAHEFNKQFGECTWKVPEAKAITIPKEFEIYFKPPYNINIILKSPDGDWLLAAGLAFSDSPTGSYIWMPKNGKALFLSGPGIQSFFHGVDFGPYMLSKETKAIAIQITYISDYGMGTSANLVGTDDKTAGARIQGSLEGFSHHQPLKAWVYSTCKFEPEQDPKNDYAKVIQKCQKVQGPDMNALKDKKVTKLPDESKTYQWNGQHYTDEEPTEWLAYRSKVIKYPPIITDKTRSEFKTMGPLSYVVWTETKKPKDTTGHAITQWFEIQSGVSKESLEKLNKEFQESVMGQIDLIGPEIREEDPNTYYYGESASNITPVAAFKNVLTVILSNSNMAPFNRAYDEANYWSYDLKLGKRINWNESFKSEQDFIKFNFWLLGQFPNKISYMFPNRVYLFSKEHTSEIYSFIPTSKGIEVVSWDNAGGHFFEEKYGTIPYEMVPRHLLKEGESLHNLVKDFPFKGKAVLAHPMVKPELNCKIPAVEISSELVCKHGLTKEFNELLFHWQKRLETQIKNLDELFSENEPYEIFMGDLNQCKEDVKKCLKTKIEKKIKELSK